MIPLMRASFYIWRGDLKMTLRGGSHSRKYNDHYDFLPLSHSESHSTTKRYHL